MTKKKIGIICGIIILVIIVIVLFTSQKRQTTQKTAASLPQKTTTNTLNYAVTSTSNSPASSDAITHSKIIHEVAKSNASVQRFVVKSPIDGSERELFSTNEQGITFEKIMQQNWSPTNRFVYVFIDYPGRRDVLFLKTDGKFTNGRYYLHSTGLYPYISIQSAKWIDTAMLQLQTINIKTQAHQKFLVNFDDDTGIVTPET